tara:strand:+ start:208 stop:648 length:441 start_codon:yes stop_codon:yes gene_type:complete
MAHFAKIGLNSKVIGVHVVNNSDLLNGDGVEDETVGKQFLESLHGWPLWIQTSYNIKGGKHYTIAEDGSSSESADQSKALRKNYAGIGMIWDEDKDMFYAKQPYPSWILDESKGQWDAPTPRPSTETDGVPDIYQWNEETKTWNKD